MSTRSKHIVISREGGDFSVDLIFAGLVRRFGKENVIDWPPRAKFRQGKPVLVGDDEKDYGAERRSLCYVESCENMREYTRSEIVQMWGKIATIFLDETEESYEHYMEIMGIYSGPHNVVVVAGHDSFRGDPVRVHERYGPHLRAMFVDDWKEEYGSLSKTHLINLSCNFDHLWDVENREKYLADKQYDICFIGYNSNPVRKVVIDHIREKWGHLNNCIIFEDRPNMFDRFVRHDEMFRLMAQSKVCLNLPGASTNGRALRYYEIPYVGSFMLSMKAPVVHLKPKMGSEFSSLEELDKTIKWCFKTDNGDTHKIERLAKRDHEYCVKYHTVDARMDYIFKVLDG